MKTRNIRRRTLVLVCAVVVCVAMLTVFPGRAKMARRQEPASAASGPVLISAANSTRAIALDSVTMLHEPFSPTQPIPFSADNRTRIMLFATNPGLNTAEGAAAVLADVEDGAHLHYPLTVEYAGQ